MRHSFIPNSEQKILKRGYHIRATIVAFLLLAIVCVVGIGALFPAYSQVNSEEQTQLREIAELKNDKDTSGMARIERELKADTTKMTILSTRTSGIEASDLIREILSVRAIVRITSIALGDISTTSASAIVQGVSPTRDALVSFKARLEALSPGNRVELPISGFAKSQDIPFSLRIVYILP